MISVTAKDKLFAIFAAGVTLLALVLVDEASGVEMRPKAIIYISAPPGCYSATFISSDTIPTAAPKKVYRVDCSAPHHYEVFWSGKFKTRSGNLIPNSRESSNFCLEESKKLRFFPRSSKSYNFEPDDETVIGNWLADRGPEASRFPQRLVCYASVVRASIRVFKETDQPLIRGLK